MTDLTGRGDLAGYATTPARLGGKDDEGNQMASDKPREIRHASEMTHYLEADFPLQMRN